MISFINSNIYAKLQKQKKRNKEKLKRSTNKNHQRKKERKISKESTLWVNENI